MHVPGCLSIVIGTNRHLDPQVLEDWRPQMIHFHSHTFAYGIWSSPRTKEVDNHISIDDINNYSNQAILYDKRQLLQLTSMVRAKGPIRMITTNPTIITMANTPRIHQFFHLQDKHLNLAVHLTSLIYVTTCCACDTHMYIHTHVYTHT